MNWEAASVVIVVIGATVGWILSRKSRGKVSKLMTQIDDEYASFKMKPTECESTLIKLKMDVSNSLKSGDIDSNSFLILDKRIDDYLSEVRGGIVKDKFVGIPENVKEEVMKDLEDGDISEKELEKIQELLSKSTKISATKKAAMTKTLKDMQKEREKEEKIDEKVDKERKRNWLGNILHKIPLNRKRIFIISVIMGILLLLGGFGAMSNGEGGGIILLLIGITLLISGIMFYKKKVVGLKIQKVCYWIILILGVLILLGEKNPIAFLLIFLGAVVTYHLRELSSLK